MSINLSEECIVKLSEYEQKYFEDFSIDVLNDYEFSNKLVQDGIAILIQSGILEKTYVQKELLMQYDLFMPMNFIDEFCKNRRNKG